MAAPRNNRWVIQLNLLPRVSSQIEAPAISQLLMIFVFSSEHVHFAIIHNRRVASTGLWLLSFNFQFCPSLKSKIVHGESVRPHSALETTEYIHFVVVNDGSVLVSRFWHEIARL